MKRVSKVNNWRDGILAYFKAPLPHLLLVSDPEGLLYDETVLLSLQDKGIEIIQFQDRAKFRYLYERYYRDQKAGQYLLIHFQDKSFDVLPYDVIQAGHPIELRISKLFPQFPASIIGQLDAHTLDALYPLSREVQGPLSSQETLDLLLRKVFKLPYDIVDSPAEFLRLLIKKHESPFDMPPVLEQYLTGHFQKAAFLRSMPVEQLITSKACFYQYLHHEWKQYLHQWEQPQQVAKEHVEDYFHQQHPFESTDLRHDLTRLFIEGKLEPVSDIDVHHLPDWAYQGVKGDSVDNSKTRVAALTGQLEAKLDEKLSYKHWLEIMPLFAEAKFLDAKYQLANAELRQLEQRLEEYFEAWMLTEYPALANLPYLKAPVMVHHIPHYLSLQKADKIALVVLDGMSFIQWKQIRSALSIDFQCQEQGVFAWVPTITSVSRQALFSGELPFHFAETIHTTRREPSAWQSFWEKQGMAKRQISYEKGLGQGTYQPEKVQALQRSNIKMAGLIMDTIDRLIHGAIQGHQGLIAEIEVWLKSGYLKQLIRDLLAAGFSVYLTSDHGNKESIGIGRINEGVLAETRGERVRIYRSEQLRNQAAAKYASIAWPNIGLPDERFMLLAKSGEAFIHQGEQVVSHGGISIEEVIVPFVHITPKQHRQ